MVLYFFFFPSNQTLAQNNVRVVRFEKLQELLDQKSEKLTIVNFWATWCEPCVAEIPHFVEIYNQHKDALNLDIIFVSLDRHRDIDQVKDFVKKHNMPGQLILLDDIRRMNQWIPKIHPKWQGTLPATGFYQNGVLKEFHTTELEKEELLAIIHKLTNST